MICQPLGYGDGFLTGVLNFVDCQARTIGQQGYQALASPGSTVSIGLTGLLTLFVALFGYRMLFGHTPSVREGVMAFAKLGIVLALATSWPAYRELFYDVALEGPAQLAGEVGRSASLPGAGGGLVGRLEGVDQGLATLDALGIGRPGANQNVTRERMINGRREVVVESVAPTAGVFEPVAIGLGRAIYLTGTIASLASVRLITGLLLALGPIFIALLLFTGTRGLFEGWVRGLVGAALGAVLVTLILGAQLALIEPWIAYLIAMREAGLSINGAPIEVLVVMLVFSIAIFAALVASGWVALGFHLPAAWRETPARILEKVRGDTFAQSRAQPVEGRARTEERSRAAIVVDAVSTNQRREVVSASLAAAVGAPSLGVSHRPRRDGPAPVVMPLEQSYHRRTRFRVSASAGRRDLTP